MARACPSAAALLFPVLILFLLTPAVASAGSVPPGSAPQVAEEAGTEAVPAAILADTAVDTLNRLIFRYEAVHFNLDSSVLLPAGQRALNRKVRWLQAHPEATVIVEGHCDDRGPSEYNMALGARRAEAARAYLIQQGIAPTRIQIVSWGKERPDAAGQDERAWSRNRRAEFLPR
jgi:peptidoglycan-associated lipoprotein